MAEPETLDLPPLPRCYVCGRPWHSTDGSTCIDALKAENERLRATIERYLEAVTSGEDSTEAWDELVLTVW